MRKTTPCPECGRSVAVVMRRCVDFDALLKSVCRKTWRIIEYQEKDLCKVDIELISVDPLLFQASRPTREFVD
jgi:hypothetical protein